MTIAHEANERLMTPGEVAAMFRVDPKTVTRWASAGRSLLTLQSAPAVRVTCGK